MNLRKLLGFRSLKIGAHRYKMRSYPTREEPQWDGFIDYDARTIGVRRGVLPREVPLTVFHETMHAIIDDRLPTLTVSKKRQEEIIEALSRGILEMLRANRPLVLLLAGPKFSSLWKSMRSWKEAAFTHFLRDYRPHLHECSSHCGGCMCGARKHNDKIDALIRSFPDG